ncbi:MAG: hypothetical protein ABI672_02170 [Vicinamibacteria bacterium]
MSASRKDLLKSALLGLPIGFRTLRREVPRPHFHIQMRNDAVELADEQGIIYAGKSKRGLRMATEAALEQRASTESSAFAFLHAGGVTIRGRAILVPGRSFAGKSTLVEALLKRGAAYLSDDMIPIDGRLRAHPFPRPLGRRPPAGGPPVKTSLKSLKVQVAVRPAPIGVIWCGTYDPVILEPSFQRVSGRDAFAGLLPHAPGARIRPEVIIPILTKVARDVPVFTGRRGEADQMAEVLLNLLERERSTLRTT